MLLAIKVIINDTAAIVYPGLSLLIDSDLETACVSPAQEEPVTTSVTTPDSSDIDGDCGRGGRGSHGSRSGCARHGGRGGHGSRGGSVVDRDETSTQTQVPSRVNISWDHQSAVILLNEVMKSNYMSLVDMPNTQLRGVGGGTGEERWPYYNHVFEILRDDPSENSGINIESMIRNQRHGVTILMTSRAEASIAKLQRNIEVAASASAVASVEPSLLNTFDTNIATATSNSRNSAGPSSRLPTRGTRRTREEYEAERDDMLFERLLSMHRESEEHTKEVLHSLAASMREESKALRRDQQQQHQQTLEMLERIARESDDRLLSVIGSFFNTRNRNGENNNNDNNS
ncbi:hypothetical protein PHYBLDRAFT_172947 [Phycomyces blakesleeanus NRRL 1555(-)]|uniref:Uncharacterized protein n=1 Tax=Phycomyces blakesleeanus (strain ATCC 8743b / DSM 1359 / FGSC 10004 / NBRC 33097 / NRRL 1555) TaxID=763407 RepID=A0A163D3U2_PHYB8|nr:hypothetical protein PHYBLDRAFT_172947 [Phycomyces blakesleeanus NRRL 1555(-)]OAD68520.1 hypothetical protein PHYBLDRAFT_172947 [Phycomyces blakesleeanus NRRL 1555(-)]|eukprot:XP_018286560.1 hypothetical protein PHYBLDRAFT_172947 [Phycomyces blakesleeanus NRRL 1555(-)]